MSSAESHCGCAMNSDTASGWNSSTAAGAPAQAGLWASNTEAVSQTFHVRAARLSRSSRVDALISECAPDGPRCSLVVRPTNRGRWSSGERTTCCLLEELKVSLHTDAQQRTSKFTCFW
eukprot:5568133-Prymnesium_polylepis.1